MSRTDATAERALVAARLRVAGGGDPGRRDALPDLAAHAVAVARQVGAPLLDTLDAVAVAVREERELQAALAAALAPARTVAVALTALPPVAVVLLGRLLDLDLLAFYGTPAGLVVAAVAVVLWATGIASMAALLRSARRPHRSASPAPRMLAVFGAGWLAAGPLAGLAAALVARWLWRPPPRPAPSGLDAACELLATALLAGVPVPAGLRLVAGHVPDLAADLRRLALLAELGRLVPDGDLPDRLDPLAPALAVGLASGGSLAGALRTLARQLRAERAARARAEAERLPTRLTFPTALCLLPATVLAIGAPIVHAGFGAAIAGT